MLAGLTQAIQTVSFEYFPGATDELRACVSRLNALGSYRFNWSAGESYRLASPSWLSGEDLIARLETAPPHFRQRSGDVYARLDA